MKEDDQAEKKTLSRRNFLKGLVVASLRGQRPWQSQTTRDCFVMLAMTKGASYSSAKSKLTKEFSS